MTVEHQLLFGLSTETNPRTQDAMVADLTEQCCLLLGIVPTDPVIIDAREEPSLIQLN
jgi:hypothetical protein